jgi:hypothetical protein
MRDVDGAAACMTTTVTKPTGVFVQAVNPIHSNQRRCQVND